MSRSQLKVVSGGQVDVTATFLLAVAVGLRTASSAHRSLSPMMRLKRFSVLRKAEAMQRKTILPFCQ